MNTPTMVKAPPTEPWRVMVDIETTGLSPGCRIWQIGAVIITPQLGILEDKFLATANMVGINTVRDDPKTWYWQEEQNQTNWRKSFAQDADEEEILQWFCYWLSKYPMLQEKSAEFWSQGSFDYPILEAALKIYPQSMPSAGLQWKFWQLRDSRTVFSWHGVKGAKDSLSHNALTDAQRQAELLIQCRKTIQSTYL